MKYFKSKKVYFLILACLISFVCISKYIKSFILDKNIEVSKIEIKKSDEMLSDIYEDAKNGVDKKVLIDKVYNAISAARLSIDKNNTQTYLDLGKTYEVAALFGIDNAKDLALQTYNEYCKLEPNNPDCYTTLAKFLLLDVTRKKEAIILAKTALRLSRSTQETKTINELITYMENLK